MTIHPETFCAEMQKIKALLAVIAGTDNNSGDNLYFQFPESSSDISLGAGETFTREITVNRKLRSITTSCDDGITIKIENNNSVWMWAYGAAGHEEFPKGVTIGTLKITVVNTSDAAARWLCNFVFD